MFVGSCGGRAIVLTPGPPAAPVCPLEGCDDAVARAIASAAPRGACPAAGEAPCEGLAPAECTERALDAWSAATDAHATACVARMLVESCTLGDAPGCGFAGRLVLDGHGITQDARRGIGMLDHACSDGIASACRVAIRWLADPEHARGISDGVATRDRLDLLLDCYDGTAGQCDQVGQRYAVGRDGFPRDLERAARAYARGCLAGQRLSCNNLGDEYEYGDGVPRDLAHAALLYEHACKIGEALGCANLGHLLENAEGVARDLPRARTLYRDACIRGETYACLHAAMIAIGSPQTPEDGRRWLDRWERACTAGSGRACAFVGLLYEDGPDGYARDERRSRTGMERGCKLGEPLACEWLRRR